jgi:hypothetical protein
LANEKILLNGLPVKGNFSRFGKNCLKFQARDKDLYWKHLGLRKIIEARKKQLR